METTYAEDDPYVGEWAAIQPKFVDEPGQVIVEANRLIMEVMQLRAYPALVSHFTTSIVSENYKNPDTEQIASGFGRRQE